MIEADRNKLWEDFTRNKSSSIREKLIIEYAGLVKIIAGRLSMYLGYNVEYDDLVGYGIFGLIDAIDKFDYSKGIKFETYASLRIRGSILDHIRKMDWVPRTLRQKQKKLDNAYQKFNREYGRVGTDEEISEVLEISVEELNNWQKETQISNLISLEDYVEQGIDIKMDARNNLDYEQPEQVLERQEIKELLVKTLDSLTEKEKKVIVFYYYEELTLKEISLILEVSESRISQLHTKALQKLRVKLGGNIDVFLKNN